MRRIPLGALQERQFRLFFTGQLVSMLGDAVGPFALIWAVLDLTNSATDLGFVMFAKVVPMVAFLLVGGVYADRLPRRAVMVTADVTRMCTQGAIAALLLTHNAQIWELIVLQAVSGAASGFFNPASTGLTPTIVSPQRLQEANGLRGMAMAATGLVGPAIAGVLVVGVGPGYALAIDAASFAVSAWFLARLSLPAHVPAAAQSFISDLREGWREFSARSWVVIVVATSSLGNFLGGIWQVLGAAYIKHHGGPLAWTVILIGLAIGGLIGGALTLRLRPEYPLRIALGFLIPWFLPPLFFALQLPFYVIALGAIVASVGLMVSNTVWETTMQQHIPSSSLSRVAAYDWFGSMLCQPVGLALAGPLAVLIGMRATFWFVAVAGAVLFTVAFLTPSTQRLRRLDEPAFEQVA
jgi:MFS family permease